MREREKDVGSKLTGLTVYYEGLLARAHIEAVWGLCKAQKYFYVHLKSNHIQNWMSQHCLTLLGHVGISKTWNWATYLEKNQDHKVLCQFASNHSNFNTLFKKRNKKKEKCSKELTHIFFFFF